MKILVVSLLRLGDFIQVAPILHGLKKKHPGSRIDVLVHQPATALRPMLPIVDRWHALDRDELQAGLGRADIPLLTPFDVLRELCEGLNQERYDLVVNLTQTVFSAWLTGYISCKSKLGFSFNANGAPIFNSPWFRYLNQRAQTEVDDVFHYTDIFANACGVASDPRHWPLRTTEAGARDVAKLELPPGEIVAVQALTSDNKKNWGENQWREFLRELARLRPQAHFIMLGAPAERPRLESFVPPGPRFQLGILSLEGALSLLHRASVLVTGDTSIKHLANSAPCQVAELSLGSSDYRRTGAYKENSLILQGRVPCAPCPHSMPCSQTSHLCAENIQPLRAASAVDAFVNDDWAALRAQAAESKMGFLQTRIMNTGFWWAGDILAAEPVGIVLTWLERSTHKFLLNEEEKAALPKFGSEAYSLSEEIARLVPQSALPPLLAHLDFLESELLQRGAEVAVARRRFNARASTDDMVKLNELRQEQNRIENESRETDVKAKLVRSLKTKLAEKT